MRKKAGNKKSKPSKIKRLLSILGPGLITGASDDDPSGIATYSQAGAKFGLATLWMSLITFPLMAAIQEMCARIGVVTSQGLTTNIRNNYPKPILYLMIIFTFPAVILNIGADIAGMGAVANLIFPSIPSYFFTIAFTIILMTLIIYLPYNKISAILKYLCVFLLLYLIVPFLSKQDWGEIARHTFIPTIKFNKDFIGILVAILGTTISPYLFFWQATMEAEDIKHKKRRLIVDKKMIHKMDMDVDLGMLFSCLVMYFITLTAGTVLFNGGITEITSLDQAAKALEPIAGKLSYLLFAFGVIGTGFLAIPVLTGCLSYMLSETFNWDGGLDKKYYQAKPFYLVIIISLLIGLAINYIGISPVQALIYTAILYGVTSPVLIGIILHISNNKKIMGEFTNGKWSNILGAIAFLLMTISAALLIYFQFK
ncbi:MAG TPA: Nramp family divalent metal transporter [Chitinophagaceae bacterium]|nr:Nramp family divalent metal transporter [Chitinophagaceae bacterium]